MGHKPKQKNHFKEKPTTRYNIDHTNEYKTGWLDFKHVYSSELYCKFL